MWRSLLCDAPAGKHITQFYRDPEFLHEAVGTWIMSGLTEGGGAIVLCTREHWVLIQKMLEEEDFDAKRLEQEGQIVFLEVHSFLERFLASGRADPSVFHEVFGQALEQVTRACRDPTQTRIWGEAVEVLRDRGDLEAAHVQEELGNDAVAAHNCSILCSYNVHNLDPATHNGAMGRLADAHSDVIPEEDYARLNEAVDEALRELYGEDKACAVWAQLWTHRVTPSNMPIGETLLSLISRHQGEHAPEIFEHTRKHYLPVDVESMTNGAGHGSSRVPE